MIPKKESREKDCGANGRLEENGIRPNVRRAKGRIPSWAKKRRGRGQSRQEDGEGRQRHESQPPGNQERPENEHEESGSKGS